MTPLFQYQRLAEPFNAAYESGTVPQSLPAISLYLWAPVASGVISEDRIFIYQQQAARPPDAVLYRTPDVATWYVQHPSKPQSKRLASWFEPFEKTVEPSLFTTNNVATWYVQHPTKPPARPRTSWLQAYEKTTESSLYVTPNLDKWFVEHPTPPPSRRRSAWFQVFSYQGVVAAPTTLDQWFSEYPTQPPLRRPTRYQPAEKPIEPTLYVTPSLDQWFCEPPTRPPDRARTTDYLRFVTIVAPSPIDPIPPPIVVEVYAKVESSVSAVSDVAASEDVIYVIRSWDSNGV